MKLGRAGRILAAGTVAAASWAMAEELGRSRAVRTSGLLALALAGGTMLIKNTSATKDLQQRLAQHISDTAPAVSLVANGGTVGGTLYVSGDHHVGGSLYGTGGTLQVADNVAVNSKALTVDDTITGHGDINADGDIDATSGTITGGTLTSGGDVLAGSGTVHAGGLDSSGTVTASSDITSSGGRLICAGNCSVGGNVNCATVNYSGSLNHT